MTAKTTKQMQYLGTGYGRDIWMDGTHEEAELYINYLHNMNQKVLKYELNKDLASIKPRKSFLARLLGN